MTHPSTVSMSTILAQAGHYLEGTTGAVVPPLQPATTFARDANYHLRGDYIYSRTQDPTAVEVERLLARLEGGQEALLFGSGLAAIAAVLETVASGQQVVVPEVIYIGTLDWLRQIAKKRRFELTTFDPTVPGSLADAVKPDRLDIVLIESPVNPTWDVIDIQAAADAAHAAGAILAVDSTVAPPVTTKPFEFGADLVVHSATKYLNGHSDLTAGVVVSRKTDRRWEEIGFVREHSGGVLGTFESWLLMRGLRTLALRYARSSDSALAIAHHFESHPKLDAVLYPGLEKHPGHELAKRQMTGGFGGMLSLLVRGGAEEALTTATALKVVIAATSLGGVESLVEHRATVEGPDSKVPPNLLRLSIGIEDPQDLIRDLEQALDQI